MNCSDRAPIELTNGLAAIVERDHRDMDVRSIKHPWTVALREEDSTRVDDPPQEYAIRHAADPLSC
jgi:hypothetical protein